MEQIVESSINREEKRDFLSVWPILLVTCIRFMTISSLVVNWPAITLIIWPLDPIQNHFIEMGLLVTLRTWFTAFSGILIGELADRFSRKKLHFFCTILLGVSYGMIGFFPTGGEYYSYFYFAICQCFAGFAMGGFAPIELSYINDKIDQNQRSQFFGMKAALGQMFMMSGMIISAFLIEFNIWKLWFWLIGGSMTISSFVILMKISEPQRASFHGFSDKTVVYDFQLNKETFKTTILATTNIVALIEGIFTRTALGMTIFLIIPYLQVVNNINPSTSALFMLIFGATGAIFGNIAFAKLSDRVARKNIENRVYLITFSIFFLVVAFALMFFIPMDALPDDYKSDISYVFSIPAFWLLGFLMFLQRSVQGIYNINQPPIIQKINLPEAQGKIMAWNQFLETIGNGIGPIIGAFIIGISGDYQLAGIICIMISIPGGLLWLFCSRKIKSDVSNINQILANRASIIEDKAKEPEFA